MYVFPYIISILDFTRHLHICDVVGADTVIYVVAAGVAAVVAASADVASIFASGAVAAAFAVA